MRGLVFQHDGPLPHPLRATAMKRPRDLADQIRNLRDGRKVKGGDGLTRETFTLPLEEARATVRQIVEDLPTEGLMTVVENWRQLADGQIEFTMRRLPTAD
jgi:hypothetical protein